MSNNSDSKKKEESVKKALEKGVIDDKDLEGMAGGIKGQNPNETKSASSGVEKCCW